MRSIAESLQKVRFEIQEACEKTGRDPKSVELLAVSKTRTADEVKAAYDAGQRAFGENYLQDAEEKITVLSNLSIKWHFIGPIQSNKTRPIAEQFDWVHSVDRLKIAKRLSEQRPFHASDLNICIQINISGEASKSGCTIDQLPDLVDQISKLPKIRLRGLMAIPEPTEDEALLHSRFRAVALLMDQLRQIAPEMDTLSMGMSDDMEVAIGEGATIVRVGTAIFGPRPPKN